MIVLGSYEKQRRFYQRVNMCLATNFRACFFRRMLVFREGFSPVFTEVQLIKILYATVLQQCEINGISQQFGRLNLEARRSYMKIIK